jgi:hypothetical protein
LINRRTTLRLPAVRGDSSTVYQVMGLVNPHLMYPVQVSVGRHAGALPTRRRKSHCHAWSGKGVRGMNQNGAYRCSLSQPISYVATRARIEDGVAPHASWPKIMVKADEFHAVQVIGKPRDHVGRIIKGDDLAARVASRQASSHLGDTVRFVVKDRYFDAHACRSRTVF